MVLDTIRDVPPGHMFAVPDTVGGSGNRHWFYRFENGDEYIPLGWDGPGIIPGWSLVPGWDSARRFDWGKARQRDLPLLGLVVSSDEELAQQNPQGMMARAIAIVGEWGPETCPTVKGKGHCPLSGPVEVLVHTTDPHQAREP